MFNAELNFQGIVAIFIGNGEKGPASTFSGDESYLLCTVFNCKAEWPMWATDHPKGSLEAVFKPVLIVHAGNFADVIYLFIEVGVLQSIKFISNFWCDAHFNVIHDHI